MSAISGDTLAQLYEIAQVEDLLMRPTGAGEGTGSVDGSLYTIVGAGGDIWSGGDRMNFMYQQVNGDFDARMWTVSRDVSKGGVFAKLGLMARESCHADARADYVLARNQAGPVPGGGVRFAHRNESRSACCWEETYQVDEELEPGEDTLYADHWRLVRTGSQITGYVGWDPEENGVPNAWYIVGSRNHQERTDDQFVGAAINSFASTTFNEMTFTLDIQPYAPA